MVSVLMPLKNAAQYVQASLASILCELDISIEVIVINDGSTDVSADRVASLKEARVKLVENDGTGLVSALNMALSLARGSLIMRCDADDLFPAGRIKEQVEILSRQKELDAICGSFSTFSDQGRHLLRLPTGDDTADITQELRMGQARTHLGTFAIRSHVARKIGGFRAYFETAEDIDFQFRLASACSVLYFPRDWYLYRIHAKSITHKQANRRRLFFDETARDFAVQRQTRGVDCLEEGKPPVPPTGGKASQYSAASHIQDLLVGKTWKQFHEKLFFEACRTGLRAIAIRPLTAGAWRNLAILILKSAVETMRRWT
jgi:glycosyltransferase involved in cell wall biosynthesis